MVGKRLTPKVEEPSTLAPQVIDGCVGFLHRCSVSFDALAQA